MSERRDVDLLLAEAENGAERAANKVRILISLVLLATVFIVGEDIPGDDAVILAQIMAAKVTLALWLLVGVVGAVLGRYGFRHPAFSYGLVTVDALLLAGNIFYGLAIAGVVGNFWSAFPAAWIVPIVIAAGALRWNPLLSAYSGALLIGLLIGIAVFMGNVEAPERITQLARLPLLYGWPPNAVRLVMLILLAIVIVTLTWRGRALIVQAVTETSRRLTLGRHLPRQILPLILDPALADIRDGSRRRLGILFVDIRGSTALAERMEPLALARLIVDFRRLVDSAVNEYGGVVDKFIGDGALVLFGVLPSARNAAADAIGCGQGILTRIDEFNRLRAAKGEEVLSIGVGVHFGEVFVGVIGHDDRVEFTALGEPVNVAARLEKATKTAGCRMLISDAAVAVSGAEPAALALAPKGAIALEGVSRLQPAYGELSPP